MTVSYQYQVASSTSGGFTRLLFMWKGSLYKLIYRELLLFLFMFGAISALYRLGLNESQRREFEKVVVYCDAFIKLIPLSFVLGFYVSYVARRWWDQYTAIPWPDKVMHLVALYVTGNDEYGRMLRRALMRYLNLSLILVLRSISSAVKRRFPTLDHVVDSGFMTSLELELFQSVPSLEFNTYWIPCTWFVNLLKEARRSHRLPDEQGLKIIMEEFNNFRSKCGLLWSYDWVSIPLVYTQVVTLATYSFFAVALIGRQYIDGSEKQFQLKIDIYLPVFTILQFFFFMGLLKVAEQLINPFGDDDEDFELNWLIDRHTKVSYLGVDTLMNRCPPLVKDNYFDSENITLPYTEAAAAYKRKTYRGSVANMMVPEEKQTMFLPDIMEEEEDYKSTPTPRTSSINLDVHTDSPIVNRRQISGSPAPTPKMARNRAETIIQLHVQDSPTGSEQQVEHQRHGIAGAMRRFTAMAKCSTPRIDINRKPFFPSLKPSSQVTLQPWPSATNLSRRARRSSPTSSSGFDSRRDSSTSKPDPHRLTPYPPTVEISTFEEAARTARRQDEGIVNTAFSDQEPDDAGSSCDCNVGSRKSSVGSDICQYRCLHKDVCQHRDSEESFERRSKPKVHGGPRFLRRHDSNGGSVKRKGVHWKSSATESPGIRLRRRTAESLPPLQIIIPQTRSSPNLRNLESSSESGEISSEANKDANGLNAKPPDKSDVESKL